MNSPRSRPLLHRFGCRAWAATLMLSLPAAAQEQQPMPPATLFASDAHHSTPLTHSACIPLTPLVPAESLDHRAAAYLLLQQLHAHSAASSGPFIVYLEPAGTALRLPQNRLGSFSLYSIQGRSDGLDLTLPVPPRLLRRLLSAAAARPGLQVCVENRNPELQHADPASATVTRILLVQSPPG